MAERSYKTEGNQNGESIIEYTRANSSAVWRDNDTGHIFLINERSGTQERCDSRGVLIKPFNPKITGRYDYNGRINAISKAKADLSPVEPVNSLQPNFKRNYVPQNQLLDGYAQMPRMIVPPYQNEKLLVQSDLVSKRRA